jgi:hypothetical protein
VAACFAGSVLRAARVFAFLSARAACFLLVMVCSFVSVVRCS